MIMSDSMSMIMSMRMSMQMISSPSWGESSLMMGCERSVIEIKSADWREGRGRGAEAAGEADNEEEEVDDDDDDDDDDDEDEAEEEADEAEKEDALLELSALPLMTAVSESEFIFKLESGTAASWLPAAALLVPITLFRSATVLSISFSFTFSFSLPARMLPALELEVDALAPPRAVPPLDFNNWRAHNCWSTFANYQ